METRMYNFKAESFNICIYRESKYEVCHYSCIDAENVSLDPELLSIQNLYSAPANEPENECYFYRSASICFNGNDIDYVDMAVSVINPLNL